MILITNADHFVGHSITSHLAQFEHLRPHLRVLCQNKTPCLNFSNKGIDVRQVNYMHPNDLALAMRGVGIMILAVGNEKERVSYSERLCKAANRYGINSIVCISHVGAGASSHETLQHFARIEDEVIGTDCQWTLLRLDWIQQYFHLWAPYIEKHRQLALPLPEDAEICPIDIIDICRVVQELVLTDGNRPRYMLHDDHVGQVYTLTGPQSVMGKQIVKWLSMDTGYSKLGYRFVRLMDARYYLEELPADIWFDARLKQEGRQIYNDALDGSLNYRYRAFATPTATQIQTFLDYFDWVHKTSSSVVVPHATAITYLPAQSIRTFFRENANRFKPRV